MPDQPNYLVLARKYRPLNLQDLRGQEGLVTTLQNAFKANKIHHAYVLTGIRGTGKTTTARIIAKALNCEKGPATEWAADDAQVTAIEQGKHVDVLEFDAASHTGVDDIKDLFEGVAYAPVQGRYKVYIIDEVHMLSKQAFNALLKTLEEPPEQVVFIFATTEVHKIPVTVLSRCLRFDLKRIPVATLAELYSDILKQEDIKAEEAAIQLIARAADGSARDGLSLLDQAIALAGGADITAESVGQMLGLADRAQIMALTKSLLAGEAQDVLNKYDQLYTMGQDPLLLLRALLETTYLLTRLKVLPELAKSGQLTELEQTEAVPLAEQTPLDALSRVYQALLTGAQETKDASRPQDAAAMTLIRITHLAGLPSVQDLLKNQATAAPMEVAPDAKKPSPELAIEATEPPAPTAVAETTPELPTEEKPEQPIAPPTGLNYPVTWAKLIEQIDEADPALAKSLAQQAVCLAYTPPAVSLMLKDGLHSANELRTRVRNFNQAQLRSWKFSVNLPHTEHGTTVTTAATEPIAETLNDQTQRTQEELLAKAAESAEFKQIKNHFPDAQIVSVQPPE